jgi:protoporphyrinogen oxidase
MKIVIIGAGPCGLGAAWRAEEVIRQGGSNLNRKHPRKVLFYHFVGQRNVEWKVVEQSKNAGGLAKTFVDDQGFLWDIGAHVAFSHYTYYTSLLDIVLPPEEWNVKKREAWVSMRDTCIPYQLQQNLYRLPKDEIIRCIDGLLEVERKRLTFNKPKTFRDWLEQSFGKGLCETFMFPYNFKVWGCPPENMNAEWMGERVATVDVSKVIANVIMETDDEGWGPHSTFRYPKHGGIGAIWTGLYKKLPAKNFHFSKSVMSIDVKKKEITYSDGSSDHYDALISTMPISCLCRIVKGTSIPLDSLHEKASHFRHSSSHIVGFGINGHPSPLLRDKTWLYFPEDNCPFYRVSVLSNFAANNVPRPGEQWSLMCEISESIDKPIEQDKVISIAEQGLKNTKLIDDQTEVVSRFHIRLEHGYPTPFYGRDPLCQEISDQLEDFQIYSRGRFGSWKYEISNQDHSLMQGVEVIDHILFGTEEMTFKHPNIVNQNRDTRGRRPLPL